MPKTKYNDKLKIVYYRRTTMTENKDTQQYKPVSYTLPTATYRLNENGDVESAYTDVVRYFKMSDKAALAIELARQEIVNKVLTQKSTDGDEANAMIEFVYEIIARTYCEFREGYDELSQGESTYKYVKDTNWGFTFACDMVVNVDQSVKVNKDGSNVLDVLPKLASFIKKLQGDSVRQPQIKNQPSKKNARKTSKKKRN